MIKPGLSPVATPLQSFAGAVLDAARVTRSGHAPILLRVGPVHVALHFDGPASTGALLPAWRSLLAGADATADGQIFIRTQSRCGPPPTLPGERDAPRGSARSVALSGDGIEYELRSDTSTLSVWDDASRCGVWWARSAEAITVSERVLPLGAVLRPALRSLGLSVVRAGAIASQRGGLLVAAPRGAGCSSTVLAARRLGLAAIADEFVAIDAGTLTAYPITGFATVDDSTLHRMPELLTRLAQLPRTGDGKQAILLDERPLRDPAGTPLRAIVVPELGATGGAARRLEGEAAEAALTRATMPLPARGQASDAPWPAELRTLPVYALALDAVPDAVADGLAEILRALD
jgi:hypothetical protein